MAKNPIYEADPNTIRYLGQRYVLADGDEAPKSVRPTSARIRVDKCRHDGVKFVVEALVLDARNRLPHNGKATISDAGGAFTMNVRPVRREDQIPSTIWDAISEASGEGKAVRTRIEKALDTKGRKDTTEISKGLFLIQAEGGWRWADSKHGFKGVEQMHELLKYIAKDRPALIYVYCANSLI